MDYIDILNKWAEFSKYGEDNGSIKLNHCSYELYKINKTNKNILENYDNTGMLSVLNTRIRYIQLLKEMNISLYDAIHNMNLYAKEIGMLNILSDTKVLKAEQDIIDRLSEIYLDITKNRLIGDNQENKEIILDTIANTLEDAYKFNIDIFKKGGKIENIKIDTKLHIFERMSECLLSLEQVDDGLYFCFINVGGTADCFFTFILKNNGNIIAINDRVDEVYINQHKHTRNARWTEKKTDKIFPYEKIFEYSDYDYKGYATKYKINTNINLFELGIDTFTPIIISMLLITIKYNGKIIDSNKIKYIDTFIGENIGIAIKEGLIKYNDSSLIDIGNELDLTFDTNKVINSDIYAKEFSKKEHPELDWDETGSFGNNQLFIEMYGQGFEVDMHKIFSGSNIRKIDTSNNDNYTPEFIATKEKMRLQVYKELREQLANYIQEEMYKEYMAYGGIDKVKKWYINKLIANLGRIYSLLIQSEGQNHINETKAIISIGADKWPDGFIRRNAINIDIDRDKCKYTCKITGKDCNYWIKISPSNWEDIEFIINDTVPKIVKGWERNGHRTSGNPILSVTDAVEKIKTPFETRNILEDKEGRYINSEYNFDIILGFSKSGWNKIIKIYRRLKNDKQQN